MSSQIIIITPDELKDIIHESIQSALDALESKNEKTYTINAVAKHLGRSHETVSKLVKSGVLKTTPDGRILQSSVRNYLK
jgi:DNA-directed RNA polymerase specialized sigma subunit